MAVRYLRDEVINDIAMAFLTENHPSATIPIPIDFIAEARLGLEINPIPGLSRIFNVEGFLSRDFSTISVDLSVYENRPTRYRFTVAHEIGHLVMHKDILTTAASFTNREGWRDFIGGMSPADQGAYEYQGYTFAGYVLVPKIDLEREFQAALPLIDRQLETAKRAGIDRAGYLEYAVDEIASILAPRFDVSTDVMIRRIGKDNLQKEIP